MYPFTYLKRTMSGFIRNILQVFLNYYKILVIIFFPETNIQISYGLSIMLHNLILLNSRREGAICLYHVISVVFNHFKLVVIKKSNMPRPALIIG